MESDGSNCDDNITKKIFIGSIIVSAAILMVSLLITQFDSLSYLTCNSDSDEIPDFIEVVIRSHQRNPYEQGSTYLPFAFLIFLPISYLIPNIDNIHSRSMNFNDQNFIPFFILFIIVSIICYAIILKYVIIIEDNKTKIALSILTIISTASLWMIERGNIIFIAVACLFIFYFNIDSESIKKRQLSITSLAISMSIKPYFGIFALLLIRRKKYRELIQCTVILFLINIISILFFGGVEEIETILNNMFVLNNDSDFIDGFKINFTNWMNEIITLIGMDYTHYIIPIKIANYVLIAGLVISIFCLKTEWKVLLSMSLVYIMYSNIAWIYLLTLFFLPLLLITDKKCGIIEQPICRESFYLFLILAVLIPIPLGIGHFYFGYNTVTIMYLIYPGLLTILSVMIIYETIIELKKVWKLQ